MMAIQLDLERKPPSAVTSGHSRSALWITLGVLTGLYAALISIQIGRHLWFDELLTYHIADASSLGRLLYLVKRWDLNPPLLHLLAHASLRLGHGNPLAIRFPSVLEFYSASLLLFWYSARKLGVAFAALPVLLLWYSPVFQYATEARPYASLCCWFCALLVLWDIAVSEPRTDKSRKLVLAGIAIASIGLLSSHVFAPLSLFAFFVAETVRLIRSRKPDFPLWSALFLPLVLIVLYLPFLESYRTITDYPVAFQAGLDKIVSFYWHTLFGVIAAIALALLAGGIAAKSWTVTSSPLTWIADLKPYERVFFLLMALVPVLLDLVMLIERSPFWGRYCITSVISLYFVFSVVLATMLRRSRRAAYAAIICIGTLILVQQVSFPLVENLAWPAPTDVAAFQKINPDLPLVAASGLTFVEMGQYESPAIRSRLFYLRDRSAAIRFAHATIFEDLGDFQREFNLPGTVELYRHFTRDHRHFLVFGTRNYPEDWLLKKLVADGAQVTPLGKFETPYKDKTLFEVRFRSAA